MSKSAKSVAKAKAKYPILAKYNLYPFTCVTLRMNEQKKKASVSMPPDGIGSIKDIKEMLKEVKAEKARPMLESALRSLRTQPVEHMKGHFAEMREVLDVYAKKNISIKQRIRGVKKSEYNLAIEELKQVEKLLVDNHNFTVDEMEHKILSEISATGVSSNISN